MSYVTVAFLYPILLGVLSCGAGLLVQQVAAPVLPAALVPVVGFGALVVVSQFTILSAAVAPLTPELLVIAALAGFVLGRDDLLRRWRRRSRGWPLLAAAAVACYVTVALPLIAAGQVTFPGYLLDTTAGFHLAAGEYMLHHGAGLPSAYPAYGAMLTAYYGHGYPTGGQVLLAASGWLTGQNLLWLYFPFQVFSLALTALAVTFIAERAGLPRWAAAISGWIASVPALVTAYAQMGSIKEITALPELLLMASVIVLTGNESKPKLREVVPFSVAAAAAIAAIGVAAIGWIAPFAIVALAFSLTPVRAFARSIGRRFQARRRAGSFTGDALLATVGRSLTRASVGAVAAALLVLVLAIPTMTRLGTSLNTAESLSGSNSAAANDPGNLLRPLRFVQVFGVWLGPSHRVDPQYLNQTYLLIGVVVVCFLLGALWLVRRGAWSVLVMVAAAMVIWAVLYQRGTEWTDAKVMMLTSPVVVLVAMVGAFGDVRRHVVQGVALALVVGGGVLASDALLYHGTNLAPSARFQELASVGKRFAGQGPTLLPDFDEYAFFLLRHLDIDSPGFAADMRRPFRLKGGQLPSYGHSYDVDDIDARFVQPFRLIIERRSPRWSRPPGNFTLVWSGTYYDVWRRTGAAPRAHFSLGAATQPLGWARCSSIRRLAVQARSDHAQLRYASRPAEVIANLSAAAHSPLVVPVVDGDGLPELVFDGPGRVTTEVVAPTTGLYQLWLGAEIGGRPLEVAVDGRLVGSPTTQTGGDGNTVDVGVVRLTAGRHAITLVRPGGGLGPGDAAPTSLDGLYLQREGAAHESVKVVPFAQWKALCGRLLDWVEVT